MWNRLLLNINKRSSLLHWLIPVLMGIFVIWEVAENILVGHQSLLSPIILLDILLGVIPSFIVGIFAILMHRAIVGREVAQRALQQRNERLTALYTLLTQINQTHDMNKILITALDWTLRLIDLEGGGVWLRENPGDPLSLQTSRGLDDSFFKAVQLAELEEILSERLAQTNQPIIIDGVSASPRMTDPVVKKEALQSCIYVPLWTRSEAVGLLGLYSYRQQQFISPDINLLTTIASQVGIVIERVYLYREMRQQLTEMTILQYMASMFNSSLDVDHMFQNITQTLRKLFDYLSFSIFLLEDQELILHTHQEADANNPVTPNTKLCQQAISTGQPAFLSDDKTVAGQDRIQELSVPFKVEDTVLGILNVRATPHKFLSKTDIDLFKTLASQISSGVYNAQLYAIVKSLNKQLQDMVADRTRQLEASQLEVGQKARQLQQLLIEVTHTQDEERNRIALDMHDGLTQLVIGALYESQAAEEALAIKPDFTLEKLQSVQNLLQQTKDEIHRIVHDLRPPTLEKMGLAPAIKRYLTGYHQLVGIPCRLNVSGNVFRLDTEVETAVYRIIQEAMHNIGKHARAGSAQISLDFGLKNVKFIVQDDGQGFNVKTTLASSKERLGLAGMKQRTQRIGGQLEIQSTSGRGTKIILKVPRPEMDWGD